MFHPKQCPPKYHTDFILLVASPLIILLLKVFSVCQRQGLSWRPVKFLWNNQDRNILKIEIYSLESSCGKASEILYIFIGLFVSLPTYLPIHSLVYNH